MNKRSICVLSKLSTVAKSAFVMLLCVGMLQGNAEVKAETDVKKPTLSVKASTNDYVSSLQITVKAVDASGIKDVKYVNNYRTTKYVKKYGTPLTFQNGMATLDVTENGIYTFLAQDNAGNTKIKRISIDQIDTTAPIVELSDSVMNQVATITVGTVDLESGIASVSFVVGDVSADSQQWEQATDITGESAFEVMDSGTYTVKAVDYVGNETVQTIDVSMEFKAVWISYLEFLQRASYTEDSFTTAVEDMFDNVVDMNMNAVVVQVRMFGDSMYDSHYFPWSKYASGTQGVDPGFDPMEIMIEEAHDRGLEFHAWLNPYRVTTGSTDVSLLSEDNPARIWLTDKYTSNDRNVLAFNNNLYYNPASSSVRKLIVNGVKEIVENYDVDGIHFDDYFYPTLGSNYEKLFDATEYTTYVENCKAAGKTAVSIANWRRWNVNTLVKSVYSAIKEIDPSVVFGISPHGNISNLTSNDRYYVDVATWMSKEGYIDYICPQLYWAFDHSTCPYDDLLDQWISLRTNENVSIYAGIGNYRANYTSKDGWGDSAVLADMIDYGRYTGEVDGYLFFRYDFFYNKYCLPAVKELIPVLAER